jgi:hypothetical protein
MPERMVLTSQKVVRVVGSQSPRTSGEAAQAAVEATGDPVGLLPNGDGDEGEGGGEENGQGAEGPAHDGKVGGCALVDVVGEGEKGGEGDEVGPEPDGLVRVEGGEGGLVTQVGERAEEAGKADGPAEDSGAPVSEEAGKAAAGVESRAVEPDCCKEDFRA